MFDVVASVDGNFVLSPNGVEFINKLLIQNQDPGIIPLVLNIKSIGAIVFELHARRDIQTYLNSLHLHSSPGVRVRNYVSHQQAIS